jgi:hypothetical protein
MKFFANFALQIFLPAPCGLAGELTVSPHFDPKSVPKNPHASV